MPQKSVQERRHSMQQAIANTRIEGHVPSEEFMADAEKVVLGQMTTEQALARSKARALAAERAVVARSAAQRDAA